MTTSSPRPIPLAARLLALAMSVVFSGVGVLAALTAHYAGRSRQGATVVLDGDPAILFGIGLTLMGLTPMALWLRTPRAAGLWAAVCLIGGVGVMLAGARA